MLQPERDPEEPCYEEDYPYAPEAEPAWPEDWPDTWQEGQFRPRSAQ